MASERPEILYVGNFDFPVNGAAAKRVLNIGRALRGAGFPVVFAGVNDVAHEATAGPNVRPRHEGFEYYTRGKTSPAARRLDAYYSFPRVREIVEARRAAGFKVGLIAGYHMDALGMSRTMSYCRAHRLAFVADCTEWYDPIQTIHGRLGPAYMSSQARMLMLNKRVDGLIAVSRFLEEYYRPYTTVIRIPPLEDVVSAPATVTLGRATTAFIYCGSPGKKDDLASIIQAFGKVSLTCGWGLDLVGVDGTDYERVLNSFIPEVRARFKFHGRVAADVARRLVSQADYSVLVRPSSRRYVQAGFPTKIVESLAVGTPVVVNATSDLADYIVDGETGLLVEGDSADDLAVAIRRACMMDGADAQAMRGRALACAQSSFDYRVYSDALAVFVEQCMRRASSSEIARGF